MKNRIIEIYHNPTQVHLFDRMHLIEGYTSSKRYIPKGGVKLPNNILAGYIQSGGKKKWRIIGKISGSLDIPNYPKSNVISQLGGTNDTEITLKQAVELLRDYYQNNFQIN